MTGAQRSINGKQYPAYVNAPRGGMTLDEYQRREQERKSDAKRGK